MEHTTQTIALLLFISALVALITRRLKLPYSIGLVLAGLLMGSLNWIDTIPFTKELLFAILLPPLIFEAAFALEWSHLKQNLPVILVLATLGVILSTGLTTMGMLSFAGWDWITALLFGTLIAATDPVAVIATFKEAGVDGRLKLLVEAESLFNDGTAAVLFALALALGTGVPLSPVEMVQNLLWTILGGIAIGIALSGFLLFLAGKTEEHLVETVFTMVAAYGSFILAEEVHCSGILATLSAGLMLGNVGTLGAITDRGREALQAFWETIAFVANVIIFMLIGIREANLDLSTILPTAILAIVITTIGRAVAIYPLSFLFHKTPLRIEQNHQHILFWGGLRGALALALALGLPQNLPHREEIIGVTFAVVTFSVFIQGLTITPLLKRLNLIDTTP